MKARLELRLCTFFASKLCRDVWSDSLSDRFQRRKFPQFFVGFDIECFSENVWIWRRNKDPFQSPNHNPVHFIIWIILNHPILKYTFVIILMPKAWSQNIAFCETLETNFCTWTFFYIFFQTPAASLILLIKY